MGSRAVDRGPDRIPKHDVRLPHKKNPRSMAATKGLMTVVHYSSVVVV